MSQTPTRPSPLATQGQLLKRVQAVEATVGRWIYVTPVAPATPPEFYDPDDPLSPPFLNGWENVADEQAVSFRIHPAANVQIRGAIAGGAIPSIVFTLPESYRPQQPVVNDFPAADGDAIYTGRIETNGDVWVTGVVSGTGSGGISCSTLNVCDWFSLETTGANPGTGYGTHLLDSGGGGILIESGAAQLVMNVLFSSGADSFAFYTTSASLFLGGGSLLALTDDGIAFDDGSDSGIEISESWSDGVQVSNILLDTQSAGAVFAGDGFIQSATGWDNTVTIPGFDQPGAHVFEVIGDYQDRLDTWEWTGGSTNAWADTSGVVGPGPSFSGFSVFGDMTYDVANGYCIVLDERRHTWTNDGTAWVDLGIVAGTPVGFLRLLGMVYDTANSRPVVFVNQSFPNGPLMYYWDGAAWNQITYATSPGFMTEDTSALGYDETNGRIVLFGYGNAGSFVTGTWTFYAGNWHHEAPANPGPQYRGVHQMAWDFSANVLRLVAIAPNVNQYNVDPWEWSGTNWAQGTPAFSPVDPLGRDRAFLAWDGSQVVLFAGNFYLENYPFEDKQELRDTWLIDSSGDFTFVPCDPLPQGRMALRGTMFAYDSARGVCVLYGSVYDPTIMIVAQNPDDVTPPVIYLQSGTTFQDSL